MASKRATALRHMPCSNNRSACWWAQRRRAGMAGIARSGEQSRTSRRGVWMLAIAQIAEKEHEVGAAFALSDVYAHSALPGMTVANATTSSLEAAAIRERM